MNFISKNKYLLFLVLGIVSMALVIPSIYEVIEEIRYYGSEQYYYYFKLAQYICLFFAEVLFIIIGVKKSLNPSIIMVSATLYYVSIITIRIYQIAVSNNYSPVIDITIEFLCLVMTVLALSRPQYLFGAIILLLVDSAFNLANTFAGSTIGMSTLILNLMLIFAIYFCCTKPKIEEVYYDQFS